MAAISRRQWLFALVTMACSLSLLAAVLPPERFDTLLHYYHGGGIDISGPSLLLRKGLGQSASMSANYYVDAISSASIDVITSATPYHERRVETDIGFDYLRDKVTMGVDVKRSEENDYDANTIGFNIARDMFGDLTTVSLGYRRSRDTVGKRDQPDFSEHVRRQNYALGLSQILTRNLVVNLNWETITDEGYLNNPYRSVRYLDSSSPIGYSYQPEVYPNTRDSNAVALRANYYLPYRAALHAEYRFYTDSWGIRANNYEIGYTHPTRDRWTFDLTYRRYGQTQADFYSDLFPQIDAQNFLARDKELSTFTDHAIGVTASYELAAARWGPIDRGSVNFSYEYIRFDYDNFRDISQSGFLPGEEPLYGFSADVLQLYLSLWY